LRELFTKVLKNHGDTDDEIYDWMLLNNGRGLDKKTRHHHSQKQTGNATKNPTTEAYTRMDKPLQENPYERAQPLMNMSQPGPPLHDDDQLRRKGFWHQFFSFVTCGMLSCF
jgi:casein kinase 1